MSLLNARAIQKSFGAVRALTHGSLDVEAGEVHVLIGSNGCGKSTLCKIIAGAVTADGGTIELDGQPIAFAGPRAAAEAGIGVFYQELSLVPQITVAENILLGIEPARGGFLDERRALAQAASQLDRFAGVGGGDLHLDARVATLRADQRQIVEICKILARDPRLIIFDEATSSLDSDQVNVFFELIRDLKSRAKGIIFISHRMDEIFAIGDRVTVMRNGESIATLELAQTDRAEILRHMIGREGLGAAAERGGGTQRDVVLSVIGLNGERLAGVDLQVRAGEILGLGGLHGQGQSSLLQTLFGAVPMTAGRIDVDGLPLHAGRPIAAMRRKIGYISGDRGRFGVLPSRPIFENVAIAELALAKSPIFSRKGLLDRLRSIVERLKLKFSGYSAGILELSGGNQQKVVIGRWLLTRPRVLLLDDPTKGIDVEAKRDFYAAIALLCAEGVAIVLYSSEDEELLANADRVLVFNGGHVVAELKGEHLNTSELYQAAYRMAA